MGMIATDVLRLFSTVHNLAEKRLRNSVATQQAKNDQFPADVSRTCVMWRSRVEPYVHLI
jgi:hypothetical protein